MPEYIERDEVMQKFADHVRRSNNSDFAPVPTWNQAVQIVEDSPTADVQPVVRCKDCANCEKVDEWEMWCHGRGSPMLMVSADGFCNYGRKK